MPGEEPSVSLLLAFSRSEPLADFEPRQADHDRKQDHSPLLRSRDVVSQLSETLTVIKSGTMIGELKNDDLVPAHDLAMSVKQKRGSWPEYALTYDEALSSFLRLELAACSARCPSEESLRNYRGRSARGLSTTSGTG
ncbi:MAG: hypothetical protein MZV63_68305 [Marinilabiliales bacterium]|nr:hypothetical protein [Marinilabiliales bacterium]